MQLHLFHTIIPTILLFCCAPMCAEEPATLAKRTNPADKSTAFFIGTYTRGPSKGIYRSALHSDGSLAEPTLVAELENPSFLAIHPTLDVLYAVSEVVASDQQVFAFRVGKDGEQLELMNAVPAGGDSPCHLTINERSNMLYVANYSSGTMSAIELQDDGQLGKRKTFQHSGSSVHPRQKGPHAHCVMLDPSGQFLCTVDLGLDQVVIYELDERGNPSPTQEPCTFSPGSGPRHIAFHPDGKHAFVIHELTCQLSLCAWNATKGSLTEIQTVSTLPGDFKNGYSTAEVLVHPSGRFVYGSNRGHHSIACFEFTGQELIPIGHASTLGETPRNFRLDPSGHYLLAENQGSNDVHVFAIDAATGQLAETGNSISVGSPVCIKFYVPRQKD